MSINTKTISKGLPSPDFPSRGVCPMNSTVKNLRIVTHCEACGKERELNEPVYYTLGENIWMCKDCYFKKK